MKERKASILPGGNDLECWFCGSMCGLHCHHIFFGKNRTLSDRHGCWVFLCYECHEGTYGVHGKYGHERDLTLKKACQRAWEQNGSRDEFRAIFGKSYLDVD